jgi:hypothetical protein
MKFGDFIQEMESEIKDFHDQWMIKHLIDPEHYPLTMEPGQWDEMFQIYLATGAV